MEANLALPSYKFTLLQLAVIRYNYFIVKPLLEQGAQPNSYSNTYRRAPTGFPII